jgi:glucose-6-phosphate isomerase
LNPKALGQLVALHEHRIFVQGVLWGIASFDQWGVELGKAMANDLLAEVQTGPGQTTSSHDPSTAQLLRALHDGRVKNAGEL